MSQPKIMTVPKDETLVAFGTMNGIVYTIVREDSGIYATYIWDWTIFNETVVWSWRLVRINYALSKALYYLDNVTGRLANLGIS